MKQRLFLILLIVFLVVVFFCFYLILTKNDYDRNPSDFIFAITTTTRNKTFKLNSGNNANFKIYWGDGNYDLINSLTNIVISHTYKSPKDFYLVAVVGQFPNLTITDSPELVDIVQWGTKKHFLLRDVQI